MSQDKKTNGRGYTQKSITYEKYDEKDATSEVTEVNKGTIWSAFKKEIKEDNESTDWYHKWTWRDKVVLASETIAWTYLFGWKRYSWQAALPYLSGLNAVNIGLGTLKIVEGSIIRKEPFRKDKFDWFDKTCVISSGLYVATGAFAYKTRFMPLHTKVWGNFYGFTTLGLVGVTGVLVGGLSYYLRGSDLWEKKTTVTSKGRIVQETTESSVRKRG